jgi:pilus assembly protein CpaE
MSERISVLIVDDIPETRENVRKLLQFESDIDVVGFAATGNEAVDLAREHRPAIILMDINMPDADGISACQTITNTVPGAQVIIMSVQSDADYLRRAMQSGARDFLMKPFSGDELVGAVRRVYAARPIMPTPATIRQQVAEQAAAQAKTSVKEGHVVAVFSPKGGNGCTTIAVNAAIGLAAKGSQTLLIDASLQFGDVAVMLNFKTMASIVDIAERIGDLDSDLISSVLLTHDSGLKVLLAPPRPEMAELIKPEHLKAVLSHARRMFDYVIVDTSSTLTDISLTALDAADRILLVTRQNLPSLKNISRFFDLTQELDYDKSKTLLVVNHASPRLGISIKDIEDTLKWPAFAVIPEDEVAQNAADRGTPLVTGEWKRRPSSRALLQLANQLGEELERKVPRESNEQQNGSRRLARLFSS